jgi:hypothetical protein
MTVTEKKSNKDTPPPPDIPEISDAGSNRAKEFNIPGGLVSNLFF